MTLDWLFVLITDTVKQRQAVVQENNHFHEAKLASFRDPISYCLKVLILITECNTDLILCCSWINCLFDVEKDNGTLQKFATVDV